MNRIHSPARLVLLLLLPLLVLPGCWSSSSEPPLAEQAAQLLLLGFRGKTIAEAETIVEDIRERRIGGVIIFDRDVALGTTRNIESPNQLRRLIANLQTIAGHRLLVAIDQEGGSVNRIKPVYGFPATHSAQYFGDLDEPATTRAEADMVANLLADLGINVNFAPVVDLNVNPDSPAIGKIGRSYSADPAKVVIHASQVIAAHKAAGVATALKHFPGHGSATDDSHAGFTDVSHTWTSTELDPYHAIAGRNRVPMVMTAHIFNETLDPEHPATLSRSVLTGLLREKIGFRGVIVSDDMQMGAITQFYGLEHAIELALNAGVDLLIFANNLVYEPQIGKEALEIIVRLVEEGRVPTSRVRSAYQRVCALKHELGLRC